MILVDPMDLVVMQQLLDMMPMMERTSLTFRDQGLMTSLMLQGPAMWVFLELGCLVPHYSSKVRMQGRLLILDHHRIRRGFTFSSQGKIQNFSMHM